MCPMSNKRGSTPGEGQSPESSRCLLPGTPKQAAALRVNQIQRVWFGGSQAGSLYLCGLVIPPLFNCSSLISFSFLGAQIAVLGSISGIVPEFTPDSALGVMQ